MLTMDESLVDLDASSRQQYIKRKRKRLTKQAAAKQSRQAHFRDKLRTDGYYAVDVDESNWSDPAVIKRLAAGAEALREHGWPATFLAMFDEAVQSRGD